MSMREEAEKIIADENQFTDNGSTHAKRLIELIDGIEKLMRVTHGYSEVSNDLIHLILEKSVKQAEAIE